MLPRGDTISVPGKDSINVESPLDKSSFQGNLTHRWWTSLQKEADMTFFFLNQTFTFIAS